MLSDTMDMAACRAAYRAVIAPTGVLQCDDPTRPDTRA